jgi:hypothetical protein
MSGNLWFEFSFTFNLQLPKWRLNGLTLKLTIKHQIKSFDGFMYGLIGRQFVKLRVNTMMSNVGRFYGALLQILRWTVDVYGRAVGSLIRSNRGFSIAAGINDGNGKSLNIPSGKLTVCYGKWP